MDDNGVQAEREQKGTSCKGFCIYSHPELHKCYWWTCVWMSTSVLYLNLFVVKVGQNPEVGKDYLGYEKTQLPSCSMTGW